MTSVEEDIELRDLVTQSLENNGVLAKIKAQLRASIFLAVEEEDKFTTKTEFNNEKLKSHLESQDGKMMFFIVREFLEFFNLQYTVSVFESESMFDSYFNYKSRQQLIEELNFDSLNEEFDGPILLQLLHLLNNKCINITFNKSINTTYNKINNETYDKITNNETYVKDNTSDELTDDSNSKMDFSKMINTPKPITQIRTFKKESKLLKAKGESDPKGESDANDYLNAMSPRSDISTNSNSINENFDKDDTFDGTSSIPEDSVRSFDSPKEKSSLIDLDKSVALTNIKNVNPQDIKTNLLDSTITEHSNVPLPLTAFKQTDNIETDSKNKPEPTTHDKTKGNNEKTGAMLLPTAFKQIANKSGDSLLESIDRIKSPPLTIDKTKGHSSLASLHDLPPLTLNKSRTSDTVLLPSLYLKDFKEKNSSKNEIFDLDLDSLDNYEEDFMSHSGSETDFTQNKLDLNLKLNVSDSSKNSSQMDGKVNSDKADLPVQAESRNQIGETVHNIPAPQTSTDKQTDIKDNSSSTNSSISEDINVEGNDVLST